MKIPKCNGRPQLWSRVNFEGIRILWPDGTVWWAPPTWVTVSSCICPGQSYPEGRMVTAYSCTTGKTQKEAIKNIHAYDLSTRSSPPEFLGYL